MAENILSKGDSNISKVFLDGEHSFNDVKNTSIFTASIECIIPPNALMFPYIKIDKLLEIDYVFVYVQFIFMCSFH